MKRASGAKKPLGFRAYILATLTPRRVRAAQLRAAYYQKRAVWRTGEGFAALTRSTYGQPYRITTFLPDWTPCGHTEYSTLRDAAREGLMFGFKGVFHGE